MADSPYLIALALFDQDGRRAMPLAGKSQVAVAAEGDAPEQLGKELALDLLLRVWQRSDDGPLQRAAAVDSLLLVELPMERLPEDLPQVRPTGSAAVTHPPVCRRSSRCPRGPGDCPAKSSDRWR